MNVVAFVIFLIALILLIVGIHLHWVIWLAVIGGLILSLAVGGPVWLPWRK
jgi:hypothetical protein